MSINSLHSQVHLSICESFQYRSTPPFCKLLLKQVGIVTDSKVLERALSESCITAFLIFQASQIELLCKSFLLQVKIEHIIFIFQLPVIHWRSFNFWRGIKQKTFFFFQVGIPFILLEPYRELKQKDQKIENKFQETDHYNQFWFFFEVQVLKLSMQSMNSSDYIHLH